MLFEISWKAGKEVDEGKCSRKTWILNKLIPDRRIAQAYPAFGLSTLIGRGVAVILFILAGRIIPEDATEVIIDISSAEEIARIIVEKGMEIREAKMVTPGAGYSITR